MVTHLTPCCFPSFADTAPGAICVHADSASDAFCVHGTHMILLVLFSLKKTLYRVFTQMLTIPDIFDCNSFASFQSPRSSNSTRHDLVNAHCLSASRSTVTDSASRPNCWVTLLVLVDSNRRHRQKKTHNRVFTFVLGWILMVKHFT